jgi:3-hydroxy-9,10-secoandrosta-1,3,5(10)-triene-9,17-dione monooxygenase
MARTTAAVSPSAEPNLDRLVAAAHELKPLLRQHAVAAEDARDLPEAVMAALKAAGFHKIYMPRRWGGYEMDWGAHYAVSRELAEACGSAGWIVSLVFSHIMWAARFPAAAQEEFFGHAPDAVLATGSAGGGLLAPADGGYRLSGRWGFVSGVSHATGAMIVAKTEADKLFSHFVLLLPGEYAIERTWDAEGLRGTGSHHIRVTDQFVPARRVLPIHEMMGRNPPGAALHQSYVYKITPPLYQKSWFAGPLLGTALGALKEYCAQTKERMGQLFGERIAEQTPVQIRLGESMAELDTAALVFDDYNRILHDKGVAQDNIVGADVLRARRMFTFAAQLCVAASQRLATAMGVSGQTGRNPVQRLARDCRTISTHIELNWDHSMAPSGKHLLGLATGDPVVDEPPSGAGAKVGHGPATRAILGTQV